jgi:hypothetical protein
MASQAIITALDSPRVKVSLSLWSLGLSLLFLVPGLTPSSSALTLYNRALPPRSDIAAEQEALLEYRNANRQYEESRGWFWSCDASCQSLKHDMLERKAVYEGARARVQAAATEARGHLGIWSTHGVEKAKEVFWGSFNDAMGAAKRSSVFDFIFYGLRSQFRDEGFTEFALKMVFRVVRAPPCARRPLPTFPPYCHTNALPPNAALEHHFFRPLWSDKFFLSGGGRDPRLQCGHSFGLSVFRAVLARWSLFFRTNVRRRGQRGRRCYGGRCLPPR